METNRCWILKAGDQSVDKWPQEGRDWYLNWQVEHVKGNWKTKREKRKAQTKLISLNKKDHFSWKWTLTFIPANYIVLELDKTSRVGATLNENENGLNDWNDRPQHLVSQRNVSDNHLTIGRLRNEKN